MILTAFVLAAIAPTFGQVAPKVDTIDINAAKKLLVSSGAGMVGVQEADSLGYVYVGLRANRVQLKLHPEAKNKKLIHLKIGENIYFVPGAIFDGDLKKISDENVRFIANLMGGLLILICCVFIVGHYLGLFAAKKRIGRTILLLGGVLFLSSCQPDSEDKIAIVRVLGAFIGFGLAYLVTCRPWKRRN